MRSLEFPPSFRGPGEGRGASGETGRPRPGFTLDCWRQERASARGWPGLHAAKVTAMDVRPVNQFTDWGCATVMMGLGKVSSPDGQNLFSQDRLELFYIK